MLSDIGKGVLREIERAGGQLTSGQLVRYQLDLHDGRQIDAIRGVVHNLARCGYVKRIGKKMVSVKGVGGYRETVWLRTVKQIPERIKPEQIAMSRRVPNVANSVWQWRGTLPIGTRA